MEILHTKTVLYVCPLKQNIHHFNTTQNKTFAEVKSKLNIDELITKSVFFSNTHLRSTVAWPEIILAGNECFQSLGVPRTFTSAFSINI